MSANDAKAAVSGAFNTKLPRQRQAQEMLANVYEITPYGLVA